MISPVELNPDERSALAQCINEVVNGIRLTEEQREDILGVDPTRARSQLHRYVQHGDETSQLWTIAARAARYVVTCKQIGGREFHARVGVERSELADVVERIRPRT